MFELLIHFRFQIKKHLTVSILTLILFSFYSTSLLLCGGSKVNNCKTYLDIKIISYPKYDKSSGETLITIISILDSTALKSYHKEGIWHYIGYNKKIRSHILAGAFQVGAWLPLCELEYLNEDSLTFRKSGINNRDWLALTAITDESAKYIVFIGIPEKNKIRLFSLNTETDKIKILGEPPSPPPVEPDLFQPEMLDESWTWGVSYADGYTVMDDGIIRFIGNDKLQVSYGKDTAKQRAKNRRIKIFNLK
jgi:hypothetical protein